MTTIAFYGFLATDFSTYYLDSSDNIPNSLIPNNGNDNIYNGLYKNIYLYFYNGQNVNTFDLIIKLILIIPNSLLYINNNNILFKNNQEWVFYQFYATINGESFLFEDILFNPVFLTKNLSQYNLINQYKGFTFPKKTQKWYLHVTSPTLATLQLIWGQGDIPQEYYSICGFAGTINVQAQNPFTNSNGPYYSTYISTNNNYASNSGWIILLAGSYDSTLVNPPYLEDV